MSWVASATEEWFVSWKRYFVMKTVSNMSMSDEDREIDIESDAVSRLENSKYRNLYIVKETIHLALILDGRTKTTQQSQHVVVPFVRK